MSNKIIWFKAIKEENLEMINKLLKDEKTNINWIDDYDIRYNTALIWASLIGYKNIVELLLEQKNISINALNCDYESALMCASWNGHFEIVKLLCKCEDICINWYNKEYGLHTALMYACSTGNINIVEYLLECKAEPECVMRPNGEFPLIDASRNGHLNIIELLLENSNPRRDIMDKAINCTNNIDIKNKLMGNINIHQNL